MGDPHVLNRDQAAELGHPLIRASRAEPTRPEAGELVQTGEYAE
jgi:hypothetical protein